MTEDEKRRKIREYNRKRYLNNKEKLLELCRNWQKRNPDKIKEYHRRSYEKYHNDENYKEKKRRYQKKRYLNNQEKMREYARNYYHENKDRMLEYQRRWRRENKEKMLGYQQKRRRERRRGDLEYLKSWWNKLFDRDPRSFITRLANLLGKRKGAT